MEIMTPEVGTIIWMLIAFGIVFVILVIWGFPMITGMVDRRKEFIENSLRSAKEANDRLADIQKECDHLLDETRAERARILKETSDSKDAILAAARQRAEKEGEKILEEAKVRIQHERDEAIRGIRLQVAELSVDIAQRVVRKNLESSEEQREMINRMIDDVDV